MNLLSFWRLENFPKKNPAFSSSFFFFFKLGLNLFGAFSFLTFFLSGGGELGFVSGRKGGLGSREMPIWGWGLGGGFFSFFMGFFFFFFQGFLIGRDPVNQILAKALLTTFFQRGLGGGGGRGEGVFLPIFSLGGKRGGPVFPFMLGRRSWQSPSKSKGFFLFKCFAAGKG